MMLKVVMSLRLKALEMQGFKSFPDKTQLDFDASITAIVGPNGSGKSNISDALRWVMGEQSTKALRSGKMEDVIFGGTEARKGQGFAQVSVILDNEDGSAPMEETELVITRRYYRSGDSEYYINRRLVRLRDINELFMDTGLGQDGYSLIGQGKVDEILGVKSKERREVFEEAAGISRFRHRKEEAERKLERTRENLLRIGDKMEELELQLEPLREQAEKATRFFKCQDRLRELEVSLWMKRLEQLRQNRRQTDEAYEAMKRQLEEVQAETDRLYRRAEELSAQMQEKERELETARAELAGKDEEAAACDGRVSVLDARMQSNQASFRRLRDELGGRGARLEDLNRQIQDKQERLSQLEEETAQWNGALQELEVRGEQAQEELNACRQEVQTLTAEAQKADDALAQLLRQSSALDASAQELESRRESIETDLRQLEELLDVARQAQLDEREERLRLEEAGQQAREQLAEEELTLNRARQEEANAQEQGTALRVEETTLQSRLRMLEDMEKQNEGYTRAVKVVLEQAQRGELSGIHGAVAQLLTLPAQYAVAIETALGGAMQNLIVAREEDGKAVFQYLKRKDLGRVTCLPMNAMRPGYLQETGLTEREGFIGIAAQLISYDAKYEKVFSNLLGRVVIVRDLDCGIAMARHYGSRFRIVTLDGQVLAPGGAMTGGAVSKKSGILSRAKEIERLRVQQQRLKERRSAAQTAIETAQVKLHEAQARYQQAQDAQRAQEDGFLIAKGRAEWHAAQMDELERQKQRLLDERSRLAARNEASLGQSAETEGRVEEEKALSLALSQERARLETKLETLVAQQSQREEQGREIRMKLVGIDSEARVSRQSLRELAQLRGSLEADDESQRREMRRLEEENQTLGQEKQAELETKESIAAAREACKQTLEDLSRARMELEAARNQAERDGRGQNETLLHAQRETTLLEQKKLAGEQEEIQLLDKLWESYELSHEAALAIAQPDIQLRETEREISSLKSEIRSLGNVNLGAIEEFARISERHEYLSGQRQDVEAAAENLIAVIAELTGEMKEIFKREFGKINAAFQETFRELFQGGRADLVLEDENDILNCGIEIQVQPPGKKLSNLNLLSGGEKAFAAIALYFGIMKVRPTPFCVLDEIEAALDEVNVQRFARYLRSICDKTQFIVITHRRGTMEEADLLYGVTMERQGVSKLLRLDLREAEQALAGIN